ncbi:MAG: PBSX family phage terminase large subunit [Desulfobacula sp.]|jgi:phage terminase large subunit|nr:PBSX family phage terminase large subunit [Desulfobacula sp.]
MPAMDIPEKLLPLIEIPKRFKVIIGGRGSAKSTTIGDIMAMKVQTEAAKVGCFREYQNSIEDSVHALLQEEIERLAIPGFIIQKSYIDHNDGGKLRFRGLARSIGGIKSMQGFKYFWVEEAQFLSKDSIKILTPTVRVEDSEIWFTGNVMSSADPFSQRFIVPYQTALDRDGYFEDDMHLIIIVNHSDNPWFPAVLEKERKYDYETLERALYDHVWEGKYNDSIENSIISADWFDACIDAHKKLGFKPRGAKIASHDPSDLGPDDKGLAFRHGSVFLDAQSKKFGDVNDGCDWATDFAIENGADHFVWDCDGMGVSLRRQVRDSFKGKAIKAVEFKGSNGVENPDEIYEDPGKMITDENKSRSNYETFRNRRAQYYWYLRDRVYRTYLAVIKGQYFDPDTMISFSSDIKDLQQLRSEICRIPRKPTGNGLIQIMTKIEMKRLLKIESPNLADAVMMSLITPEIETNNVGYRPKR